MSTIIANQLIQTKKQSLRQQIKEAYKKAVEEILDPASAMTEEECRQFEQKILAKLKSGKNLSSEEMNYLKIHNPVLYRTAMRVKLAKQRLKEQLKHCRSKEEANDVIAAAIGGISDKDPDREYLVAGLAETAKNFRKDSHYARLPETIEKSRNRKGRSYDFDDEEKEDDFSGDYFLYNFSGDYSPVIEIIQPLSRFDIFQ